MSVYSGQVEPTWIAEKGALVYEDASTSSAAPATPPAIGPETGAPGVVPPPIRRRYDRRMEP